MKTQSSGCRLMRDGRTIVMTPTNALGELNFPQFERDTFAALNLLRDKQVSNVIIDLHQSNQIGSNTVNLFLQIHHQVQRNRGKMALCRVPMFVREVLRVMKLHDLWPFCESRDEALKTVHQRSTRILVVDDCYTEQRLIHGLLSRQPTFEMQYAEDGWAALKLLNETIPDLVLTDLLMPGMDGLELLDSVRALYPQVPVILMTAYANRSVAAQALERGAVSFISKSNRAFQLADTIKRVVRGISIQRSGHLGVAQSDFEASFLIENDREQIGRLVDFLQQLLTNVSKTDPIEQLRMGVAVEEALLNAMYHGNLEITNEQWKRTAHDLAQVEALAEGRRYEPGFRDRYISLEIKICDEFARFVVGDQGPGFDTSCFARHNSRECFERGRRRGSMLICTVMDQILHNERGNIVTLVRRHPD